MDVRSLRIPEVKLIEPAVSGDQRGYFMETWQAHRFAAAGLAMDFVQDNRSRSVRGSLRGLHYQIRQPQGKLVSVVRGEVFDVAVDMRQNSPTFGRWVGVSLSDANKFMLWIPPGFAHGFYVTSEVADFEYKCTDFHVPQYERTVLWNDSDLDIDWPLVGGEPPRVSREDAAGVPLQNAACYQ